MIRALIGVAVLAAVAIVFLLTPSSFGASQRRALAVMAVRLGAVPLGAGLLQPLARAGDAIAQNDLGVLLLRGKGDMRDPIEAARLLNAAAATGLARAQLNLLLIRAPWAAARALAPWRAWRLLRKPGTAAPPRSPRIASTASLPPAR